VPLVKGIKIERSIVMSLYGRRRIPARWRLIEAVPIGYAAFGTSVV
jgi:hypothetical protein